MCLLYCALGALVNRCLAMFLQHVSHLMSSHAPDANKSRTEHWCLLRDEMVVKTQVPHLLQ